MAVVVEITFPGTTLDQYDAIVAEAGLAGAGIDALPGARAHYAFSDGPDLRVIDIWDSPEAFKAFIETTIVPAAKRVGLALEPTIAIHPLHNSLT
jgi:hypothetical protein